MMSSRPLSVSPHPSARGCLMVSTSSSERASYTLSASVWNVTWYSFPSSRLTPSPNSSSARSVLSTVSRVLTSIELIYEAPRSPDDAYTRFGHVLHALATWRPWVNSAGSQSRVLTTS